METPVFSELYLLIRAWKGIKDPVISENVEGMPWWKFSLFIGSLVVGSIASVVFMVWCFSIKISDNMYGWKLVVCLLLRMFVPLIPICALVLYWMQQLTKKRQRSVVEEKWQKRWRAERNNRSEETL